MKKSKKLLIGTLAGALSLGLTSIVNAYVTYGNPPHKLINGPYYTKYWNGVTREYKDDYGNTKYLTFDNTIEVDYAVDRWNNTQNTKVWMQKTSYRPDSIIDFVSYPDGIDNVPGQTIHYNNYQEVAPSVSDWYWAEVQINNGFDYWYAPSPYNGDPGYAYTAVAAHEMGHALGLDHDPSTQVLMYREMGANFYQNGIYYPTSDEADGVRAIYGPLY